MRLRSSRRNASSLEGYGRFAGPTWARNPSARRLGLLGILGDVGRLAAAVGIDMKDAFSPFEHFNPGQTLPQRAKRISAGQYSPPSFEMSMARKDLRLIVETGRAWRADAGDGAGAGSVVG